MKLTRYLRSIGTIYLSRSTCIYENLAFEEWLFRNHDLRQDGEALLLWSNTSAVVIGRHQNPFLEANLKYCRENSIRIARRYSGGGTVYHDLGNLNVSFITSQARHCRPRNLRLLADSLNRKFGTDLVTPNYRDDLVFVSSGCKVSGTAARISHGRAYHHLTLLVDAPLDVLKSSLSSNLQGKVETNATTSVKAKSVGFLRQKVPDLNVADVRSIVTNAFSSLYSDIKTVDLYWQAAGDPQRDGLLDVWRQLKDEDWIFGRTPRFRLSIYSSNLEEPFQVVVDKGYITESGHSDFPVGSSFLSCYAKSKYF